MKQVTIQTTLANYEDVPEDLRYALDEGMESLIKTVKRELKRDDVEDEIFECVDIKTRITKDRVYRKLDKPDFVIGKTRVYILGPHESITNESCNHTRYWGPNSILTYRQDEGGTQWSEYDLHNPEVWKWIASLAVIGAKVCEREDKYWDSPEMEKFVND